MISEYVLPGEVVFPEGIAEDPDGVRFYVSSMREGTVFRCGIDAERAEIWLPGGTDGRTEAVGMTVHPSGLLLVCGGRTGQLFGYRTDSGELAGRQPVPAGKALLNDVCVVGDHAYVTDSERPVVWRFDVRDGVGRPDEWLNLAGSGAAADNARFLNGIVAAPDGTALIVAAQVSGVLWRIDLATREAAPVDLGGAKVHADGLVFADGSLFACDNSRDPDDTRHMWLTSIGLAADLRSGAVTGQWERPLTATPTTVAHIGDRLYLVNSQFWAGRTGTAAPPFTVSAIAVPAS